MKRHIKELLGDLHDAGINNIIVIQNSHTKITWRGAAGRKCTLVVSTSPSDRNAAKQMRRDLKHLLAR
jgi:hypothetical protein